jgi:hypothetical protein
VIYHGEYVDVDPRLSDGSTEVEWVPVDQIDQLPQTPANAKGSNGVESDQNVWIDDVGD